MRPGTCGETIAHRQTFFDQNFVLWRVASPCATPKKKWELSIEVARTPTDESFVTHAAAVCRRAARIYAANAPHESLPRDRRGIIHHQTEPAIAPSYFCLPANPLTDSGLTNRQGEAAVECAIVCKITTAITRRQKSDMFDVPGYKQSALSRVTPIARTRFVCAGFVLYGNFRC